MTMALAPKTSFAEAAEALLERLAALEVPLDPELVRADVILHDAGKVLHPAELDGPGNRHEDRVRARPHRRRPHARRH
jgi:hypothetical protein